MELLKRRRARAFGANEEWRKWCPQEPTPRQREFLALDCREAFYGGAAGPGKSSSLLMAALQYVHVPGYAALLFRRDFQRLALPGALMDRAKEWFIPRGVRWSGEEKTFRFPSGATITFGYLDKFDDRYRYQSSEFQFIGFDELTEFPEDAYTFMFSRNRKTTKLDVPLRFRAASNPGGIGHDWVMKRFISKEALSALSRAEGGLFWQDGRAFVPGRLKDNPFIDAESYRESLSHLDPVTRERLLNGDWSVTEDGRIKPSWMRYYGFSGEYYYLQRADGTPLKLIHPRDCERFVIVDCAGSSEDKAREKKGKPPSHSVISTFDFHRVDGWIIFRDMRRGRWEFPALLENIRQVDEEQNPAWIGIENEKVGQAALQSLKGLPAREVSHQGKDKLARAGRFLTYCEQGKFYLPETHAWRDDVEKEWFRWTGDPDEPFDIGDTAAYAGLHAGAAVRTGYTVILGAGGR